MSAFLSSLSVCSLWPLVRRFSVFSCSSEVFSFFSVVWDIDLRLEPFKGTAGAKVSGVITPAVSIWMAVISEGPAPSLLALGCLSFPRLEMFGESLDASVITGTLALVLELSETK